MKSMYDNFTPDEIQELKDQFLDNECCTDQYRETQPVSGLHHCMEVLPQPVCEIINRHIDNLDNIDDIEQLAIDISRASQDPIALMVVDWLCEAKFGGYYGSDELYPLLEKVFDCYVEQGEHPYGYDEKECREWINL